MSPAVISVAIEGIPRRFPVLHYLFRDERGRPHPVVVGIRMTGIQRGLTVVAIHYRIRNLEAGSQPTRGTACARRASGATGTRRRCNTNWNGRSGGLEVARRSLVTHVARIAITTRDGRGGKVTTRRGRALRITAIRKRESEYERRTGVQAHRCEWVPEIGQQGKKCVLRGHKYGDEKK